MFPPCLSRAEPSTQSSSFLFMVPLWSPCRSRSLSLMLSVNEAARIVPGVIKRRHGVHAELEGSSSSAATVLAFLPPCNRKLRSHAQFRLGFTSWVRGEEGEGNTGRHCQEVACPFTVISASVVLSVLQQVSHCFVMIEIWWQFLIVSHLRYYFFTLSPAKLSCTVCRWFIVSQAVLTRLTRFVVALTNFTFH